MTCGDNNSEKIIHIEYASVLFAFLPIIRKRAREEVRRMKLTASTDAMQICGMLETFICRDITTIRSDAQLENIRPYRGVLGNNSDRDNTNQAGVRFQ